MIKKAAYRIGKRCTERVTIHNYISSYYEEKKMYKSKLKEIGLSDQNEINVLTRD